MKIKIKQKIVTIGGGAGSSMVLTGLKKYSSDLSAVVSMADDGGSSGVLRHELGVLPPGDARQCLIALAKGDGILKELFAYRYESGSLAGHTFGNLFLATLEKVAGGFNEAIKLTENILKIKGRVLPVTLNSIKLVAVLNDGQQIVGEGNIYGNTSGLINLRKIYLKPAAVINPRVKAAIASADKIIICPGDLYSSLIPNFLVKGMPEALKKSRAKIIYIGNLMTKPGHTDGFTLVDYVKRIEKYTGSGAIEYVIYNKERPEKKLLKKYLRPGEALVQPGNFNGLPKIKFLSHNLLSRQITLSGGSQAKFRSIIRHDSDKLAKVIYNI